MGCLASKAAAGGTNEARDDNVTSSTSTPQVRETNNGAPSEQSGTNLGSAKLSSGRCAICFAEAVSRIELNCGDVFCRSCLLKASHEEGLVKKYGFLLLTYLHLRNTRVLWSTLVIGCVQEVA